MGITQLIVLAVVQGLTEFLPISSSGHLILVPSLFGWSDQGLAFDVAVHFGSLIAVCIFFRVDIYALLRGMQDVLVGKFSSADARMFWNLGLGTIPAGIAGLLFAAWIATNLRDPAVVVTTLAIYGFLMALVDRYASANRNIGDISNWDAIFIGCAQALALIPGTSRSGITITVGRLLGIARSDAAKFSFLLSIPIVLMATLLEIVVLVTGEISVDWSNLALGVFISTVVAYISIKFFMRVVNVIGLLPFAIYRLVLASVIVYVLL